MCLVPTTTAKNDGITSPWNPNGTIRPPCLNCSLRRRPVDLPKFSCRLLNHRGGYMPILKGLRRPLEPTQIHRHHHRTMVCPLHSPWCCLPLLCDNSECHLLDFHRQIHKRHMGTTHGTSAATSEGIIPSRPLPRPPTALRPHVRVC